MKRAADYKANSANEERFKIVQECYSRDRDICQGVCNRGGLHTEGSSVGRSKLL